MMFAPGIITVLVVLIALQPALLIALLLDLFKIGRALAWVRQRRRPLQERSITRATWGAFGLVICAVIAANGFPVVGWEVTAGIAALALLYLIVGIQGSRGARFDFMAVFWRSVLALGCLALLIFIGGFRL